MAAPDATPRPEPIELGPIRGHIIAHLHPLEVSEVQAWAIMCGLINAFEMGEANGRARAEAAERRADEMKAELDAWRRGYYSLACRVDSFDILGCFSQAQSLRQANERAELPPPEAR